MILLKGEHQWRENFQGQRGDWSGITIAQFIFAFDIYLVVKLHAIGYFSCCLSSLLQVQELLMSNKGTTFDGNRNWFLPVEELVVAKCNQFGPIEELLGVNTGTNSGLSRNQLQQYKEQVLFSNVNTAIYIKFCTVCEPWTSKSE